MMQSLTCKECRDLLPAYYDSDQRDRVPAAIRRQIGAHLDTCPACDARYRAHRGVTLELRSVAPLIGSAERPPLGAIWSAVQSELIGSRARPVARLRTSLRYSVALVTLLIAILLPMLISGGHLAFALPVPPTPVVEDDPEITQPGLSVVVVMATPDPAAGDVTPTLPQAPRYAPTAVSTEIP